MPDAPPDLAAGFAPADFEDWRRLAVRALGREGDALDEILTRRTADGVARGPLFTSANAPKPAPPLASGAGPCDPDIMAAPDHPDPAAANLQVREALEGGANGVEIVVDPTGAAGCLIRGLDDLERVLNGVDLATTPVHLAAGDHALPAAALMVALAEARGAPSDSARFSLGVDPLGRLAARTNLPRDLDLELADAAHWAFWTADAWPGARVFRADGRVVHEAGGSEAWEVGFAAAAALAYLEHMVEYDLPLDLAARQISFAVALDADVHLGIAKLRALRRIWERITSASGVSAEFRRAPVTACSSNRMLARRDPWTNIMRLTATGFAAACGGADAVRLAPFTAALGGSNVLARRLTRNIPLLLKHEFRLGRVADPAAGSFHHEALTDGLAQEAWKNFQTIQAAGGLGRFIVDGELHAAVARGARERVTAVSCGEAVLIGVSAYPPPSPDSVELDPVNRKDARTAAEARAAGRPAAERAVIRSAPDQLIALARAGVDITAMTPPAAESPEPYYETPLRPMRDAALFEDIAEAADALADRTGVRPAVYLACVGARADYAACAKWAEGAFRAGGFAIRGGDPHDDPAGLAAAAASSGARLAVVCASQRDLRQHGPDAVAALVRAGVTTWSADAPDDLSTQLLAAGAVRILRKGEDLLVSLRDAQKLTGAAP